MTSMKMPFVAEWLRQRQRWLLIGGLVVIASAVLVALGQVLAAIMAVIVGALWLEIEQHNLRARVLAQQLVQGLISNKIEVPRGAWGELCRAINTITQEQRRQEHLRRPSLHVLAEDQLRVLLEINPAGLETQRVVAVLLVSCGSAQPRANQRRVLGEWQTLAKVTQSLARQHGALLQPCGDAILLAFGALQQRPIEAALVSAITAADALRTELAGVPLAIAITSGSVNVTTLPGLGCCIIGEPVERAMQIKRLALAAPSFHMLCDESAYYALRRYEEPAWRPTEFRIPSDHGQTQVVYGAPVRGAATIRDLNSHIT